jgi:dolichol kinase
VAADAFAEIGGSILGKQTIQVRGIGDVNRKSVAGTVSAFVASLALCLAIVFGNGLAGPWIVLAVVISASNALLELYSPRGTDDFTMATTNALICWAFGVVLY